MENRRRCSSFLLFGNKDRTCDATASLSRACLTKHADASEAGSFLNLHSAFQLCECGRTLLSVMIARNHSFFIPEIFDTSGGQYSAINIHELPYCMRCRQRAPVPEHLPIGSYGSACFLHSTDCCRHARQQGPIATRDDHPPSELEVSSHHG